MRALSQHLQHSQKQRRAGAHAREGQGVALRIRTVAQDEAGGKNRSTIGPLVFPSHDFPFPIFGAGRNFSTRRIFLELSDA
jgi:hypothetical protein